MVAEVLELVEKGLDSIVNPLVCGPSFLAMTSPFSRYCYTNDRLTVSHVQRGSRVDHMSVSACAGLLLMIKLSNVI